jgi:hypothetical protein
MGDTAEALDQWLRDDYLTLLVPNYTVDAFTIRELGVEEPAVHEVAVGDAGTLSSQTGELPAECCMVITWRTAVATRSGRGRQFIPSPRGSGALSGPDTWKVSGPYWEHAADWIALIVAGHTFSYGEGGLEESQLTPEVWSRVHNTGHDITSGVRRSRPHWLRSRSTAP